MKVVQVMPEFGLAGAEIMCENLTYELRKLGHDVIVISMYDYHSVITERLEAAGVEVRYLQKKPGLDPSMIGKIRRVLKEECPDVVHTHRYCAQYAIPAAILCGIKGRVHTLHSIAQKENTALAKKLNYIFYKFFHLIPVALSDLVCDSIQKEYRIKRENIPVILNGVDLSKCIEKENYEPEGKFTILHIGRFAEVKNHLGLLAAFKMFHDKHPDSELWLIGDGEERVKAETFVKEQGLQDAVKFFGVQSNVYGYLHDADLFTLPSNYEGIPMTLIEAMGTGVPIVATAVGGVPDMLDENCAILTQLSKEQIAQGFESYYQDASLRERHGKEARKRSVVFSSAEMAKKYCKIYESCRKAEK